MTRCTLLLVTGLAACGTNDVMEPMDDPPEGEPPSGFVERTAAAGFRMIRIPPPQPALESMAIAGGVAAGDFDDDGDVDLFVVSEGSGDNLLYRNAGDGTFEEVAAQFGVGNTPVFESGPVFADYDGDGDLDLIIGGIRDESEWNLYNSVTVLQNTGTQFVDVTSSTGLDLPPEVDTYSVALGDVDGDGDLDVFLSHWRTRIGEDAQGDPIYTHGENFLWRNTGAGGFVDMTGAAGLASLEYTFTGNLADVDGDGDLDLLVASDFVSSKIMLNDAGVFTEEPTSVLDDENGMGGSVGDYDNDGDLDWFVTSIWDPNGVAEGNWGVTGNRLYQNDGAGRFTDVTDATGTRQGYWGWGSCFADFDNDGHLDLFHVNGMAVRDRPIYGEFLADPSRLFMSNGNGTFTERAAEYGLVDLGQGRGLVCFDADRDGDIDIFVANNAEAPRFYVNEIDHGNNYLGVVLRGVAPNTQGVGALITITPAGGTAQIREIRAGGNYVSQDPAEAHFGLGQRPSADVSVRWPDGEMTILTDVAANQVLVVSHPAR